VSSEQTSASPPIRVRLEIQPRRDPIEGVVRDERGAEQPFVGWLGLMERLEAFRGDDDP
jgi:hypothetical protein